MAKEILEGMGYALEQARPPPPIKLGDRWIRPGPNDLWGCADLVGIKESAPTLFVQVSSDSGVGAKAAPFGAKPIDDDWHECQYWRWVSPPPGLPGHFHVYRRRDGWAFVKTNTMAKGDTLWPWDRPKPPKQEGLKKW